MTSIKIPDNVTYLGSNAFTACTSLTNASIGNSVKSIRTSAFKGCGNLSSVTIGTAVSIIDDYAFNGCISLSSVIIPNNCTSIGFGAFKDCSSLNNVSIGKKVSKIENQAFNGCNNLRTVTIDSSTIVNKTYTTTSNILGIFGSQVTKYVIGNSVNGIGDNAFYESNLSSVTIGTNVSSIGEDAFFGCNLLSDVTIRSKSIVSQTYKTDKNISDIFGKQVKKYIIPSSDIGAYAFYDSSRLVSVEIGSRINKIGDYAFYKCDELEAVICSAQKPPELGTNVFNKYSTKLKIFVPNGYGQTYSTNSYWSIYSGKIYESPKI